MIKRIKIINNKNQMEEITVIYIVIALCLCIVLAYLHAYSAFKQRKDIKWVMSECCNTVYLTGQNDKKIYTIRIYEKDGEFSFSTGIESFCFDNACEATAKAIEKIQEKLNYFL